MKAIIPENWYTLFDKCNPNWVWQLYRGHIEHQILNSQPISLPFLSEHANFNVGGLVIKVRDMSLTENPCYSAVGPLTHWVTPDSTARVSSLHQLCDIELDAKDYDATPTTYELADRKSGIRKDIAFTVEGYCKFAMTSPLKPDTTQLCLNLLPKRTRDSIRAIYLIDRVWYAPQLRIEMRLGAEAVTYKFHYLPIGFTMTKYRLNAKTGFIGEPLKLIANPTAKMAEDVEWTLRESFLDPITIATLSEHVSPQAYSDKWEADVRNLGAKERMSPFLQSIASTVELQSMEDLRLRRKTF